MSESILAIGISYEHEGFSGSRNIAETDRETVSKILKHEFGVEFDEILVVKNDDVIDHWRREGE